MPIIRQLLARHRLTRSTADGESVCNNECMRRIHQIVLVAIVLTIAAQARGQNARSQTPFEELTANVTSIASAGVPGPLAVFDSNAFPVVAGKNGGTQLPVVVASMWGRGRVVAFGHGGMIGSDALKHEGTAALVVNATKWLTGRKKDEPNVGVVGNDAMVALLAQHDVAARSLPNNWFGELDRVNVLIIDSHRIDEASREEIRRFILHGGGLMTAGLGWGWLQLHPGKTINDHPGNMLLRDAGIAWCDGTVSTTANDGFAVGPLDDSLHALFALQTLIKSAKDGTDVDKQTGATLIDALRVVPTSHMLARRAADLLNEREDSLVVSEKKPLKQTDGVERVLLALEVETERRLPADRVAAQPSAAFFPGEVPSSAPRVERDIEVDLSVPDWHSTGLYAPPGRVIVVTAPSDAQGCGVRIGCHTDHLWHHDTWKRVPDISRHWDLEPGANKVASAFGGLIYIQVPRKKSGTATFTVRGAVESPRYVLGQTTDEQWKKSREAPGPWGELESSKVILSVPSESLRTLENPEALMQFWDKISDAHATLAMISLDPTRPHRFVADVQISAGYMHSGYPIMTHLDAADDMTQLEKLSRGSWGLLHELGHNHQEGDWTFAGTGEVTCNLFALHAIDTICTPKQGERGHGGVDNPPSLAKYLDDGAKFDEWKREPFLALHMYVQLQNAFGWETFQNVFAEYQTLKGNERPKNDDEKRDQWMVRFSRACGHNLGPFFEKWGVPTSEAARASIADLPNWMPDDWPR